MRLEASSGSTPPSVRPSSRATAAAAAVCSAVVTITFRASTQLAARPCDVSAAATMRLLTISPTAAMASSQRGVTFAKHCAARRDDALELVKLQRR